jgi:hypothetical protein
LYGRDIRESLPAIASLDWDFDDILARGLYHFDKSFRASKVHQGKREVTKGVFKSAFYLCVFYDRTFRLTSIRAIANRIEELMQSGKLSAFFVDAIKECILFRRGVGFESSFKSLRSRFLLRVFSLLGKGALHRRMRYRQLLRFLKTRFTPFQELVKFTEHVGKTYLQKTGKGP